jgi:hypothetical protein
MNSPNYSVGRTPSLLCQQFSELLSCLEKNQPLWIDSRYEQLTDIPRDLEVYSQKISSTLSELRRKLRMNGFSTLRQWEESKSDASSAVQFSEKIRETADRVKRLMRIQNLLAQNLLILVRGVAMLNQARQNVVYSPPIRNGRTSVSNTLHYRG